MRTMGAKAWCKSLAAAVIGGAANAVAVAVVVPEVFDWSDLSKIAKVIVAGAIIALAGYLKQSPVPPDQDDA